MELWRPSLSVTIKDLADNDCKISTINIHPIIIFLDVYFNEDTQTMVSDLRAVYHHLKFKLYDVDGNNSIVSNTILNVVTS